MCNVLILYSVTLLIMVVVRSRMTLEKFYVIVPLATVWIPTKSVKTSMSATWTTCAVQPLVIVKTQNQGMSRSFPYSTLSTKLQQLGVSATVVWPFCFRNFFFIQQMLSHLIVCEQHCSL